MKNLGVGRQELVVFSYLCIKININTIIMRTKLLLFIAVFAMALGMQAKKYPQIKFEKTTVDFGTFSMDDPIQK